MCFFIFAIVLEYRMGKVWWASDEGSREWRYRETHSHTQERNQPDQTRPRGPFFVSTTFKWPPLMWCWKILSTEQRAVLHTLYSDFTENNSLCKNLYFLPVRCKTDWHNIFAKTTHYTVSQRPLSFCALLSSFPHYVLKWKWTPSVKGSGIKWSCDLWFDTNLKNVFLSSLLGLLCSLLLYASHHSSLATKDSFLIKVQMSSQGIREGILIALFFVPSSSPAMHNALIVVEFISSSCFWMKVGSL